MSQHDHLLRPYGLRRLILDLENDAAIIEASTDIGAVQIDLHELHAHEANSMLERSFDAAELETIRRFLSASMRAFA